MFTTVSTSTHLPIQYSSSSHFDLTLPSLPYRSRVQHGPAARHRLGPSSLSTLRPPPATSHQRPGAAVVTGSPVTPVAPATRQSASSLYSTSRLAPPVPSFHRTSSATKHSGSTTPCVDRRCGLTATDDRERTTSTHFSAAASPLRLHRATDGPRQLPGHRRTNARQPHRPLTHRRLSLLRDTPRDITPPASLPCDRRRPRQLHLLQAPGCHILFLSL